MIYGYVYMTLDATNGLCYVGQRKGNKFDENYYGSGKIIKNIIKKRKETLKHCVLRWCETKEELDEMEIFFIECLNTIYPNGYNLAKGGEGGSLKGEKSPNYGKHHSDETKKKISDVHKGKHLSEETKNKMSDAHKGKTPWNKGKHHSDETKNKMSDAKPKKLVLQYTKQGVFVKEYESIIQVERETKIPNQNIVACCKGKLKSAGGYIWKYKN